MILKTLWRRRTRSLLTILGIAIGVAAVVALGAMARGMTVNYATSIAVNNDLLVLQANAFDPLFSSLDEEDARRIEAIPGVASVEPGIYAWIATEDMPFFLIFGYEPGSQAASHYRIVEGKPVTGSKQIAIGRRAAESLKKNVDDTVRLYGVPYHIAGIYETGQAMEESGGLVTLGDAQEISQKPRQVSLFQVGVQRGTDMDQVVSRIQAADKDLSASVASEYDSTEQWAGMIEAFAWGIAAIAILVGGLGMMNTMVMSVLERTREIGVLRALGWRRSRIVSMILGEAIVLSLIGGAFGAVLGVVLTELSGNVQGIGGFLEGIYSPDIFLQGMLTALLLGVLGGAYPAWHAANLQPVEALRYEGGAADRPAAGQAFFSRLPGAGLPFRNLWRRRMRTLISATGIGIGVATLVMLGGMSQGVIDQLNSLAGSSEPGQISLMQAKVADLSLSTLDEQMAGQIRSMPGVKSVSPMLLGFEMTPDMPFLMIGGLDPNSGAMKHYKLAEGRYIQRPNEVVLGKIVATNFKVGLGDWFTLYDNRYRVVGIVETGVAYEDGSAMLALREAQRLLNRPRQVSFIFVDATSPAQTEPLRAALAQRFPDAQVSLSSNFAQETDSMGQLEAMTAAIGLLALLVGGIVVANTMMMSIYERTREIGVLRALGWPKRRILNQVVQEGLLLCLLASVLGAILGVAMMELLVLEPTFGALLPPSWNAGIFVRAVLMALVVGLIAGLYPAWRASRLQPVEALRYE